MSGGSFGCHSWQGDANGIDCVEVGDTAKRLTMHRTVPTTKDYPGQSVNSANVEEEERRGWGSWRGEPRV